jgi:hypothetical protein
MAIALSTAGITVSYCAESTAGTRPSGSQVTYTVIPDVKSIPAFGDEINTLQSTPLSNLYAHSYVPGLRDSGGSIALTANMSNEFKTAWETAVSAYEGLTGGKTIWWQVKIPGMDDAFFFPGQPVSLGFSGAEVDSVLEATANVIPSGDYEWATKE